MIKLDVGITVTERGVNAPKYVLENDISGQVSLEELLKFTKQALIFIALDVLREEQAKGFDKKPVQIVDNQVGKNITDVSPLGKIEFIAGVELSKFLITIYQGLLQRSPVKLGTYVESHWVTVNGELIAKNLDELSEWVKSGKAKQGDKIRIVNLVPYAGKLERDGVTATARGSGSKRMVANKQKKYRGVKNKPQIRAPNGAYFLTLRSVRRQFGKVAYIDFAWVNGRYLNFNGFRTSGKDGKAFRRTFSPKSRRKGQYAYPSLYIVLGERGVT